MIDDDKMHPYGGLSLPTRHRTSSHQPQLRPKPPFARKKLEPYSGIMEGLSKISGMLETGEYLVAKLCEGSTEGHG